MCHPTLHYSGFLFSCISFPFGILKPGFPFTLGIFSPCATVLSRTFTFLRYSLAFFLRIVLVGGSVQIGLLHVSRSSLVNNIPAEAMAQSISLMEKCVGKPVQTKFCTARGGSFTQDARKPLVHCYAPRWPHDPNHMKDIVILLLLLPHSAWYVVCCIVHCCAKQFVHPRQNQADLNTQYKA